MFSLFSHLYSVLSEDYAPQEIMISKEALFKGVSTRFGLRTIENQ
jgi:hypothetical protein